MTATRGGHIGALDGLRAGAILLVLLYHFTPGRESSLGLRALPFKLADIGWTGVDLFFVLSGFLITTRLLAARGDEHRFRDFYIRRALRIIPLYYGTLVLVLFVLPLVVGTGIAPLRAQLPYWLYYSNFHTAPLPTDAFAPIGHFWSLALEEQFYLVWPAVVFLCSRRAAIAFCLTLPLVAMLLRFVLATNGAEWYVTYAWTPMGSGGLAIGALLALLPRHSVPASALAFALTAPFYVWALWRDKATLAVISLTTPDAILIRTLLPFAASVMFAAILVLSIELGPLSRVLSIAPLRALARYSYGMYVAHFMLIPSLKTHLLPRLADTSPNVAASVFFVAGTLLSLAIAMITYHGYEVFFLRLKSRYA